MTRAGSISPLLQESSRLLTSPDMHYKAAPSARLINRELALLALAPDKDASGASVIVGIARSIANLDNESAEFAVVTADEWTRRYARSTAAFPPGVDKGAKYWPPVARVDNVYGDRNLFCSCIPLPEYASPTMDSA